MDINELKNGGEEAYERCVRPVMRYFVPSETPGLRRMTEVLVAWAIAWEADADGVLPHNDMERLADLSRVTKRTFRRYWGVLIDTGWLIQFREGAEMRTRIDPVWLKNLPPAEANDPYGRQGSDR